MKAAAGFRTAAVAVAAAFCAGCTSVNLAPDALEGTDWRVVTVNGRQTPAEGEYTMRFGTGGAFGARLGCNLMGGEYRLAGSTLTVGNLTQTLMGCPDPAMTFENQGSAILSVPMQVAFSSNERMTLSNAGGSITLDAMK